MPPPFLAFIRRCALAGRRMALGCVAVMLAAGLAMSSSLAAAGAEPAPAELTLEAIGWRELSFARSNGWVSVSSHVALREVSVRELTQWLEGIGLTGQRPAAAADTQRLLLLQAENRAADNVERLSLWTDPVAGRLLQRCRVAHGRSDQRAKCYRYEADTVFRERRESESGGGAEAVSGDWMLGEIKDDFVPDWPVSSRIGMSRPPLMPEDASLISPMLLLPVASATRFATVGDETVVFVHTDKDFYRVTLRFSGHDTARVDYRRVGASGDGRQVDGSRKVLVIEVHPTALAREEDEFALLGLTPPLQVLLDPETRVPLAVRGRTSWIGNGEVQLEKVRLVE